MRTPRWPLIVVVASQYLPIAAQISAGSGGNSRGLAGGFRFHRATAYAFNRAIGEVLDAPIPWIVLSRLSWIVLFGLVLYLGWIQMLEQPDLALWLILPHASKFQQRCVLHHEQVQNVWWAAVAD